MKRCYLVVGPESAGNRVLASVLLASGKLEGVASADSNQGYNRRLPTGEDAVVIRSFPHGGEWPDLGAVLRQLTESYDLVTVLVTVRHPFALYASQVARGHVSNRARAYDNARHAWVTIFAELGRWWGMPEVEWFVVPYESLADGGAAELLYQLQLGALPDLVEVEGEAVELENRNAAHFRSTQEVT